MEICRQCGFEPRNPLIQSAYASTPGQTGLQ